MTLRLRILTVAAILGLMALGITLLALASLNSYDRMMSDYGRAYENAFVGEKLNHTVSKTVMNSRGIYISATQERADYFAKQLEDDLASIPVQLDRWKQIAPAQQMPQIQEIENTAEDFIELRSSVAALTRDGRIDEAKTLGLSNRQGRTAFQEAISAQVNNARQELDLAKAEASRFREERTTQFLVTAAIGLLLILGLTFWLTSHFITTPLHNITRAIVQTSEGDYNTPLTEPKGNDEVARVWRAIHILREKSKEAERLAAEQAEAARQKEMELRQIVLD